MVSNVISFKKRSIISKINFQIEHTVLEDGSFWYRMYNPLGAWWTEWIKVDKE